MDCNYKTLSKELSKIDREIRRGSKACSYHPSATNNIILLRHRSGGNGQICMAKDLNVYNVILKMVWEKCS